MSHAAPPEGSDLLTALQAAKVFSIPPTATQALFDLDSVMVAAYEQFQTETTAVPFLKEEEDSTRRYDPPGPGVPDRFWTLGGSTHLVFLPPYQSITSITAWDDPGQTGDGQLLVENTDYILEPPNRQEHGQIRGLRFRYPIRGGRTSLVIVGKVGYCATISDFVWNGLLALGMAMVLEDLQAGIMSRPTDWREGDSAEKYNVETLLSLQKFQEQHYDRMRKTQVVFRV